MELAADVRDILAAHDIQFWLDYGALLGAVRDGRLIPWDVDVDFGIFAEDVPSVTALADEFGRYGHYLDTGNPLYLRVTYSKINELHLDLYWWTEQDGLLSFTGPPGWDWPGSAGTESFPPSYLESMITVRLEGEAFPAPSPVEQFLSDHRYGSAWRQPTRPVRVPGRVPPIGPDEMSDQVREIVQAVVEAEEAMDKLTADHLLGHTEGWRRWVDAGMSLQADPTLVATLEARYGSTETPLARQLLESLAIVRQGLAELSHRSAVSTIRRNIRRLIRIWRRAHDLLDRRPLNGRRRRDPPATSASNR